MAMIDGVKLTTRGRADVWLANGHDEPPDGRPLVVQVHEIGWHQPELGRFLDPAFRDRIEAATQASVQAAARVITPSQVSRGQVVERYARRPDEVHIVAHGVDHALFRPGISGGRERLGTPYILFVGVLHRRKNLTALRDAVGALARDGLPHTLVVVGNEPGIETSGGFPGRVRHLAGIGNGEVAALMAGADAFCLPSFFEGFGLPALEAMACGAPVVVSDRGALPEVVGDAGRIVEPNAAAIEAALRGIVTNPVQAQRLGQAGIARASEFTWERSARGWLDALEAAA